MKLMAKRQVKSGSSLTTVDIVMVGILLAAGSVLRIFCPPFFGITPNFTIGMYCLAICLIRPRFIETLGIGLVAAMVCHLTTKSLVPYLNFLSEPAGAIAAYLFTIIPSNLSIGKYTFKPALVTFGGTITSGLVYITLVKFLVLFSGTGTNPAFTALLTVVLVTAATNILLAQLAYQPISTALGRNL
jgi:hypothetical protein